MKNKISSYLASNALTFHRCGDTKLGPKTLLLSPCCNIIHIYLFLLAPAKGACSEDQERQVERPGGPLFLLENIPKEGNDGETTGIADRPSEHMPLEDPYPEADRGI